MFMVYDSCYGMLYYDRSVIKSGVLNADSVTRDTLIMTMVNDEMTYGESLIHNTQYHGYDKSMDIMLKNTDYDPDTTDIYLYDDDGVFICGNVPLYYLNWDIVKKNEYFTVITIPKDE